MPFGLAAGPAVDLGPHADLGVCVSWIDWLHREYGDCDSNQSYKDRVRNFADAVIGETESAWDAHKTAKQLKTCVEGVVEVHVFGGKKPAVKTAGACLVGFLDGINNRYLNTVSTLANPKFDNSKKVVTLVQDELKAHGWDDCGTPGGAAVGQNATKCAAAVLKSMGCFLSEASDPATRGEWIKVGNPYPYYVPYDPGGC